MSEAAEWLCREFQSVVTSEIYSTPPFSGLGAFYSNMVVAVSSPLSPDEMIAKAKAFETLCGRSPRSKQLGQVPMDVDVVICNGEVLRPTEMSRTYFTKGFQQISHHEVTPANKHESVASR